MDRPHVLPPKTLFILTGPTASGKDAVAAVLAEHLRGEIVCLDAIKVYHRMEAGTDKPDRHIRAAIPHHLIDIVEPNESYSVGRFLLDLREVLKGIELRQTVPILVGGTAMYLKCLRDGLFEGPPAVPAVRLRLKREASLHGVGALHERLAGVDPSAASRIHHNDLRRIVRALEVFETTGRLLSVLQKEKTLPPFPDRQILIYGLRRDREALYKRINRRVEAMLSCGLVEEVRSIVESCGFSRQAADALGYRQTLACVRGELPFETLAETIKRDTRRFAKRQLTWFRNNFPEIHWVDVGEKDSTGEIAEKIIRNLLSCRWGNESVRED